MKINSVLCQNDSKQKNKSFIGIDKKIVREYVKDFYNKKKQIAKFAEENKQKKEKLTKE